MTESSTAETSRKICEACGAEFGCGAESGACWCQGVDVPAETASQLQQQFTDCICPKCLVERAGKPNKL